MNNILEMIKNEKVEWKKLGDNYVSNSVTTGLNPRKNFRLNDSSDGELTCWYITTKDYSVNEKIEFVEGKTAKITENARIIINKRSKLEINDILFSAVGTVGKVALVDINPYNFDVNESTFVIKPNKENIIPKFLVHYLRTDLLQNDVKKFLKGSTLKGIRKKTLLNLQIPIPSLKTQEKIVETLDKFEKYSTELQAELQAELQNRSSQYEYFRDLVLSEDYLKKLSKNKRIFATADKLTEYNIEEIAKIRNGKDWKKLNSGGIPVYGSGGYMNVSVDKYVYNKPTVLIPRKGSIENIFYLDKPFWNVDTIFYTEIDETKIIPKYFYYFMKTLDLKSLSTNSTRPSLTQTVLNKVKIKLPSLEIQNKVVEVLDRFQDLISNAEGLLPEEIEQRQKQYEYYREKLLTFENNMVQVKSSQVVLSSCYFEILREACELVGSKYFDIKTKRLEDVCEILDYKRKPISKNKRIKGIYPYYGANGVQDYVNDYIFDGTYILMGEDGSVIDKNNNPILHWVDDKKIWVNNHAHVLKNLNNEINLKYVFYYLSTCDVSSIVKGTPPKINQGNLRKIRILIPPMNVQEYVVSILDKFDMLVNNINDGLPKEIELRQKQYEYYREKLLDFPRKEIS